MKFNNQYHEKHENPIASSLKASFRLKIFPSPQTQVLKIQFLEKIK